MQHSRVNFGGILEPGAGLLCQGRKLMGMMNLPIREMKSRLSGDF
jgi:hypothetical protein